MRNNDYNLVVLHHGEVFETRELALEYLNGYYKPFSLDAEPVIVKYGNTNSPNVILAFGTVDTAPGGYYAIDMTKADEQIEGLIESNEGTQEELDNIAEALNNIIKSTGLTLDENKINDKITYEPDVRDEVIGTAESIAEAVDLLSKYTQQEIANCRFNVEDTESVNMIYEVNTNGEMILKAEVKVSTDGDSDDVDFNNNIIGIKNDGLYAASHLAYDDVRHELIFTTSGVKNGRFQDDAIVQRVELGEHVNVQSADTDTINTVVENVNNVATIKGNVKLGSNNSIVVRNGGLEANISIDVDQASNKLTLTVGNQTFTEQLPGVELFESAEYNDANEELIITFRTGNTLVIPIHGIIHTWDTNNTDNSPIILTKTVVTGGVDKLSGNIKLRSTDNLIGIENGRLYVSEQNINNKVSQETTRATAAEDALRTSIETLTTNTQSQMSDMSDRITTVQDNLTAETTRATAAENEISSVANHADEVATEAKEIATEVNTNLNEEITNRASKDTELEGKINTLTNNLANEVSRAQTAEETINTRITHDISDVNAAITTETTRATAAEAANSTRIDELEEAVGAGSAQTLADAKAYTDTKVTAEKTEREAKDVELATAIETAKRDAADDATEKATSAKNEAKTYTDTQVAAEQARAEAAEAALITEVNKKIETVEIVKNSQSDLQYTLKVDGQDAGEINIPKDQFLKSVSYSSANKEFTFEFETTEGTVTTVVNVSDLVDTYTAGDGLVLDNNQFSVKINEDSESYLTVSDEGIKLLGIDAKLSEFATNANNYTDAQILTEKTARETKDTQLETAIGTNADAISVLNGNEATTGSVQNAIKVSKDYTDAQVATKANANDVYTKNEIDRKGFLTEHQDISNLATISSLEAVSELTQENTSSIQENTQAIQALEAEVDDMKFITNETNTVRMTMVKETGAETRVLTSDVKLKTIAGNEGANIIKSDSNGLYATVDFNYDKTTNKITFNDGNGSKVFELNNFGILQDAIYDSQNKEIVLIVKKDDETTERIEIPVGDLVNTWTVENVENSPVILTKTETENGDVLSAGLSILNNAHNLLTNQNGSLFVDSDANQHVAMWGNEVTSVQGAINALKERTDDIEEMKQDIEDLEEDNENIKIAISTYQTDLENQKQRISDNEDNIDELQDKTQQLEVDLAVLTERVDTMGEQVQEAVDKANEALTIVNNLNEIIGVYNNEKTISERLDRIEEILEQLIDFGEYDIQL